MLRGALAAAVTPLRDEGAALDEYAFRPYLDFLAAGGLDGILALGTTGEGILLSAAERRRAAELFLEGPLPVIVHCGAQTTAETTALAEHAAASGAAGVAELRAGLDRYPFQAAAKYVLGRRGVPVREDVRAPLRPLADAERKELDEWLESS